MKVLCWILFYALIGAVLKILWDRFQAKKAAKSLESLKQELTQIKQELEPFKPISDISKEIEIKQLQLELAKTKYDDIKKASEAERDGLIDAARRQAESIIGSANKKAEEIGGEALLAVREAKRYEVLATAMKNTIEGYGTEYLIPHQDVLDQLAEEYSFKDAGQQLKSARDLTRKMIRLGIAAQSDYTEIKRKQVAIEFVLDAFNGKVDSLLSSAKHDNFGTLSQKVKDAYALVNNAGTAFRNSKITVDYLESRITELKWLVAVNEIKRQEIEEQRRIKQEMREEEKARREYEKAIMDAAKEEKLLEQAMEQAKNQLAHASAEQKAGYEAKLRELEEKLKAAEEKNQRALSMAQQTRRGHVYVISNIGSFGEDVFKIGLTRRLEPLDRVRELGDASVPFDFDVHALIFSEDAPALEAELHRRFAERQVNKVNPRKEFFRVGIRDVKSAVDNLGLESKWTLVAEAQAYRETVAIEKGDRPRLVEDSTADIAFDDEMEESQEKLADTSEDSSSAVSQESSTQEAATAPCPLCQQPLVLSTLQVGMNTCPHCKGEFEAG